MVDGRGERGPVVDVLDDARIETSEVVRRSRTGVGLVVLGALAAVGLGVVALRGGDEVAVPVQAPPVSEPDGESFEPEVEAETVDVGLDIIVTAESWNWVPLDLPADDAEVTLIGEVIVATVHAAPTRMWHLADSWVPIALPGEAISTTSVTDGVIVVTDETGVVSFTTDLGRTWRRAQLEELPGATELVWTQRSVFDAVLYEETVVMLHDLWSSFDAEAYLQLVGDGLAEGETAVAVGSPFERIEVITPDGETLRSIDVDRALLSDEAWNAIDQTWSADSQRLLRVDVTTGAVIGELESPAFEGPVVDIESVEGQLRARSWDDRIFVARDGGWQELEDEPWFGTIGGVDIDLQNGLLRLERDGVRAPWPGTGLGVVHGEASAAAAVLATDASQTPTPTTKIDVPEGSVEFTPYCCLTLTTDLGSLEYRVWEGRAFPGEIVEGEDGWTFTTDITGPLTLGRTEWDAVLASFEAEMVSAGSRHILTTTTGTEWSLVPLHETLGATPLFLQPQVGHRQALLVGRSLPVSPLRFVIGAPGGTVAWIAEIPS